jgi:hypothetical protein
MLTAMGLGGGLRDVMIVMILRMRNDLGDYGCLGYFRGLVNTGH